MKFYKIIDNYIVRGYFYSMGEEHKHYTDTVDEGAPTSWCVLPWSHINIQENGQFKLCCHSNSSHNKGLLRDSESKPFHVNQAKWEEVLNSNIMKRVRKNMLEGKWSEECVRCKREHDSGILSRSITERRHLFLSVDSKNYPDYKKTKQLTNKDGSISLEDFSVSYLDIHLGNHCNLKCIMCSPMASNKWYEDYEKIWKNGSFMNGDQKIKFIKSPNKKLKVEKSVYDWSENPHLLQEIEKHIDSLRVVYVVGGEPLLIKAHYDFLEKCIERGVASKISLNYNTNITHLPNKIWNLWRPFREVIIGASIDGTEEVNDLIRYPSKWSNIEKNLLSLDQKSEKNLVISITSTISSLNIWNLPEFIKYLMKSNYLNVNIWTDKLISNPHPLHNPDYLNLNILEDNAKEKIKNYFERSKKEISGFDWESNYGKSNIATWNQKIDRAHQILDNYINFMHQIKYTKERLEHHRSMFVYFMDALDKIRNTDWAKVCPEIYEDTLEWRQLSQAQKKLSTLT